MTEKETNNPWNINSIYQLQYFNCPCCHFKHFLKQDFINHAYKIHPEAVKHLDKIKDGSLGDILCPWEEHTFLEIENETTVEAYTLLDIQGHSS